MYFVYVQSYKLFWNRRYRKVLEGDRSWMRNLVNSYLAVSIMEKFRFGRCVLLSLVRDRSLNLFMQYMNEADLAYIYLSYCLSNHLSQFLKWERVILQLETPHNQWCVRTHHIKDGCHAEFPFAFYHSLVMLTSLALSVFFLASMSVSSYDVHR